MGMGSQGVPQIGPLDLGYTTGIPLYLGVYHWDTPVSGYPAGIPLYLGVYHWDTPVSGYPGSGVPGVPPIHPYDAVGLRYSTGVQQCSVDGYP